jgi:ABC transporter substrate binding protein
MRLIRLAVVLAVSLLGPLVAEAESAEKVYRIGFLRAGQPPETYLEGFQQGLRERGYVYGQNVVVELRATDGSFDQLPRLAEELVRLKVDVILASAAQAALAVRRATTSVPIVFVGVVDPVELGLVPSLGRPDGNITGLTTNAADLAGKRLELLRELVPKLSRAAVLWHPANPTNPIQLKGAQIAARALGVQLAPVSVQEPNDFDSASKAVRGTTVCCCWRVHFSRRIALASRSWRPRAGGPHLWPEGVCRSRRPHIIWYALSRLVPACSPVCGQDFERRQARGSASRTADQVRAGHQPQGRQGAGPDDSAVCARARGPDHRVSACSINAANF